MNYLGHAFLSFDNPQVLLGNMIGDHVKGNLQGVNYPEGVVQGIRLHRRIDDFVDKHAATKRAQVFFRADYRLYSGAIMDTIFDHFLANDPKIFLSEGVLAEFTQRVYSCLQSQSEFFPARFAEYLPYMTKEDWLYNYRTLVGIKRSLNGLARRAKYMPPIDKAYEAFVTHYYSVNQAYFELIDDLVRFVKIELNAAI